MIQLRPGLVIAIAYWWGEHWGVVAAQGGRWTLISNRAARAGVTEEPLEALLAGRRWHQLDLGIDLPGDLVVARARSALGSRYDFWRWNCEDLVYWVHGLNLRSPQRNAVLGTLALAAIGTALGTSLGRR